MRFGLKRLGQLPFQLPMLGGCGLKRHPGLIFLDLENIKEAEESFGDRHLLYLRGHGGKAARCLIKGNFLVGTLREKGANRSTSPDRPS